MIRALRRYHRKRMIAKAVRVRPHAPVPGKIADNLQVCSGRCCGNERHWEGPTMQERRALSSPDHATL